MSLKEIFSDSLRYPFSNLSKFVVVGILTLIAGFSSILTNYTVEGGVMAISGVVSFIAGLLASGYGVSIIRQAISKSDDVPSFSFMDNLFDGIKYLIILIVYLIIPTVIVIVLAILSSMGYIVSDVVFLGLGITVIIVAVILFIFFGLMGEVAIARFANTGELSDAFALIEVFRDMKRIGILKIIGFIIIQFVILLAVSIVMELLGYIPYVGMVIAAFVGGAFELFFTNRSLGLLYGDRAEESSDEAEDEA